VTSRSYLSLVPRMMCPKARLSFAALALLSACASPIPPTAPPLNVDTVILSGKLSVRIDALNDSPPHSLSALFDLRSTDGQSGQLELSSPLGTLMGRASWDPHQARLTTPKGERAYSDLSALSEDLLGERVPMEALFDWLNSRPWPGATSLPLPEPSRGFSQLGWSIKLDRENEGVILAERASPPAITVIARLIR
jgi:outer membrane lipoprotein LolB